MEPVLLGVDLGTSSAKGVLVSRSGQLLAKASWSYSTQMLRPGWVEHNAEKDWWLGFVQVVNSLLSDSGVDPKEIVALGCSAIGPCVLPMDERGTPLRNGILYGVDCRAHDEIEELKLKLLPHEAIALTANPVTSQSVLPKVMWLRKNEPEIYRRTRYVLDAPGYLVYKLTGQLSSDLFTAASGGVVDINTLTKSKEMFDAADVNPDLFPDLVWPATVVGEVTPEAAKATGLCPGTPVIAGTCDAAAECLGAGMSADGDACLIYGTTAVILACTVKPVTNQSLFGGPYCLENRYILGGATAAAGALTTWYRDNFAGNASERAALTGKNVYQVLYESAMNIPPGSDGLVVLPYFSGARTPVNDEGARGAILGLTLCHTGEHLYHALLEGVGYEIRHHVDVMRESGVDVNVMRAVGGGAQNVLWTQVVSDITGVKQICVENPIGAPLGAAYLAALGADVVDGLGALTDQWITANRVVVPNPETKKIYDALYSVYRGAYLSTRELNYAIASASDR